MRKICLYSLLCLGLISIYSCSQNQKRVQTFADTFVGYVNGDQFDSIRSVYPTANFDSVAPLNSDSIQIAETDGVYHIDFGSTKWIEVKENEDGTFTIENSKGIAAFPEDKYNVAVNTGMLNDSISDTKAQELMNDSTFFAWLNDKAKESSENILSIEEGKLTRRNPQEAGDYLTLPIIVKNNLPILVKGDDYELSYILEYVDYLGDGYYGYRKKTVKVKGEDIEANGTAKIDLKQFGNKISSVKINFNQSKNDLYKYFKPTGKEYQEYLDSKK